MSTASSMPSRIGTKTSLITSMCLSAKGVPEPGVYYLARGRAGVVNPEIVQAASPATIESPVSTVRRPSDRRHHRHTGILPLPGAWLTPPEGELDHCPFAQRLRAQVGKVDSEPGIA